MSQDAHSENSPQTEEERLLEEERKYLELERQFLEETRRQSRPRSTGDGESRASPPQRSLCGLALSGGGIRSATFNLGVLQGLRQRGVLGAFDYVATVSGGGYLGGFWTAWRHYHHQKPTSPEQEPQLFPTSEQGARGMQLREVRHLREFSNFLSPRLGLLSSDTGRLVVAVLSALLPSLLAALSFIVLVLLGWVAFTTPLLVGGWGPRSYGLLLLLTGGCLLVGEWRFRKWEKAVRELRQKPGQQPPGKAPGSLGYYVFLTLLMLIPVLALWRWLAHPSEGLWPVSPGDTFRWGERLSLFTPALTWLGSIGALVLVRWLFSRWMPDHLVRTWRAAEDRLISRLLILAGLWSVLSVFWLAGQLVRPMYETIAGGGLVGVIVVLATVFARVQQLFGRHASKPVTPNRKSQAQALLPQVLAYVILGLTTLGLVLLIQTAHEHHWLGWLGAGAGAITLFTLFFFDPNQVGLHAFYRSRIARTFIGAAHDQAPGQTENHEKDDLPLDHLEHHNGPLHLLCCAANDLQPVDPMANLYRGADSAVLSPVGFSVGRASQSWERIRANNGRVPTLASAMTASGAAINSHMGSISMRLGPAVTFLMTALNLRLGLWWSHPHTPKPWLPTTKPLLVGLPFYAELFSLSRVKNQHVLLSDGGHFENLALYELVRRKCQFILVSDCAMDMDAAFDDFANAVRRVREDFRVEIRVDLSPLRAGPDGLSRQTVVAGEIEYPDGNTGVLLLLKPTLQGDEPPDITQYKTRNAAFPHESTGDQFYDEAQWEAYRRLGEHAALTIFRNVQVEGSLREAHEVAQLFAHARYDWLPVPAGYEERYSRIVARAASLDALLRRRESRRLFLEIFKEITDLDEHAKRQLGEPRGLSRLWPRRKAEEGLGPPVQRRPSPHELADSLQLLRRALLFMEEVFLSENLAIHYNHPAYRGLLNYFARWAYAPRFRIWWPLLKTQFSPRFTHFLEERFSLPAMKREDIGELSQVTGLAMKCWLEQNGRPPRARREQLLSYQLNLPFGWKPEYHVQAAQLILRTHDRGGAPLRCTEGGVERPLVAWQGDDFFVPPGLWGAGIGGDFLHLLITHPRMRDYLEDGTLLAVQLLVNRDAPRARRQRWADDLQLYRSHGFSEPTPEQRQALVPLEKEFKDDPALPWTQGSGEQWQPYWLVRSFSPRPSAARAPHPPQGYEEEQPTAH